MGRGKEEEEEEEEGGGRVGHSGLGGNMSNIVNIKGGDAVEISIHGGKKKQRKLYIYMRK